MSCTETIVSMHRMVGFEQLKTQPMKSCKAVACAQNLVTLASHGAPCWRQTFIFSREEVTCESVKTWRNSTFLKELDWTVQKTCAVFATWAFLCHSFSTISIFFAHVTQVDSCLQHPVFDLKGGIIVEMAPCVLVHSSCKRIENRWVSWRIIFFNLSNVLTWNILFSPPAWSSIITLTGKSCPLLWSSLLRLGWKMKATCCHLDGQFSTKPTRHFRAPHLLLCDNMFLNWLCGLYSDVTWVKT